MRIAIVGSRTFDDYQVLVDFVDSLVKEYNYDITEIVSGGARGADRLGERYAAERNIEIMVFKPDWVTKGKFAGYLRNKEIINYCDVCIAFWDGKSRGTKHDIDLCERMGKPCHVYNYISGSFIFYKR
ncbi:MAG: DUF2493 domain-containing protein [Bacteroidales bacterium]|nr:DUF2493 domain-containing protein [Bacteroidales bacterium]